MENDEIVQALRATLRRLAEELTPDVPPADVYSPGDATVDESKGE